MRRIGFDLPDPEQRKDLREQWGSYKAGRNLGPIPGGPPWLPLIDWLRLLFCWGGDPDIEDYGRSVMHKLKLLPDPALRLEADVRKSLPCKEALVYYVTRALGFPSPAHVKLGYYSRARLGADVEPLPSVLNWKVDQQQVSVGMPGALRLRPVSRLLAV